jgi:nitrogen fixation protein FixH
MTMAVRDFVRLDAEHPFTGWHMIFITVAFFGVIIAVNVTLAIFATGTFPGLVVENSYVASQQYNELLAAARVQAERGWKMSLDVPAGQVDVVLTDTAGHPIRRLQLDAIAGRPSSTLEDRRIDLLETDTGYRSREQLPLGRWNIDIEARQEGKLVYRELRRVFVQPAKPS